MPYFFSIEGEMRVILCLKKASQFWELPGKKPARIESRQMLESMIVNSHLLNKFCLSLTFSQTLQSFPMLWRNTVPAHIQ